MRDLEEFWSQHERVWVTDLKQDTQILSATESVHWLPYQAPRDLLAIFKNLGKTLKVMWQERPDLVICTGASLAINFSLIAKITNHTFIYIESISRVKDLSISGKVAYYLADEFYVQWPELIDKYPKAIFQGRVSQMTS